MQNSFTNLKESPWAPPIHPLSTSSQWSFQNADLTLSFTLSPHSVSFCSTLFLVFGLQPFRSFCFISIQPRAMLMLFLLTEMPLSTSSPTYPQVLSWFIIIYMSVIIGLKSLLTVSFSLAKLCLCIYSARHKVGL